MYQNVIFDLYGTLVDIRTDESSALFWSKVADFFEKHGARYLPETLRKTYRSLCRKEVLLVRLRHPFIRHFDIDLTRVFRALYEKKGVSPSDALISETAYAFRRFSTKFIRLYDGALDLLAALKARNKKIFLLSNAQRAFTIPELEDLGILSFFDGILISSDEKMCKPEKRFFEKLIETHSLKKDATIMVGNDQHSDIAGANAVGIDSLYIYQEISPPFSDESEIASTFKILDGNVFRIKDFLLS